MGAIVGAIMRGIVAANRFGEWAVKVEVQGDGGVPRRGVARLQANGGTAPP
jgi:hypothetical protein